MSVSLSEGLEEGGQVAPEHDVNTDAGFYASLAEKVGRPLEGDEYQARLAEDRSVARGLEEGTNPPRDDKGRFAPTAQEVVEEPPADPAAEVAPEADPPAASPLEKQLEDAQSFIGRQANELGELRERLAKMEGRLEATPQPAAAPPSPPLDYASLVEANGGQAVVQWVAQNRPLEVEAALDAWYDWATENEDYRQQKDAIKMLSRWEAAQLTSQAQPAPSALAPEDAQYIAQQREQQAFNGLLHDVSSELGLTQEAFVAIQPHMPALDSEEVPALIRTAISSSDVELRKEGLREYLRYSHAKAIAAAGKDAAAEAADKAKVAKQAATVVSGSLRPAERQATTDAASDPAADREARIRAFKDSILSAPSTSVQSGLTFGS